jgi:ABC-2 type transport system permease protein
MNPWNLLRLEWRRYSRNPTFRVLGALYAGSFALVVYLARSSGRNMTFSANHVTTHPLANVFVYPQNWTLLACIGSWMNIFLLGFLGVSMITMEFSNRTLRQSIIFGQTRLEVAVSKLIWSVALAAIATGFYILLALGGEAVDGGGLPVAGCVAGFFLQALGYVLLGTLVGLVIRQTALAAMAYLSYVLFLETVCRWIFYFSVAKTRALLFLPSHVLGALTPLPIPDSVGHLIQSASTRPLSLGEAMLAALIYIGMFAALFCRIIVRSDL